MNKKALALFLAVLTLAFVTPVFAAAQSSWEKIVLNDPKMDAKEIYLANVSRNVSCKVVVMRNGDLKLWAEDLNVKTGRWVIQDIFMDKNKSCIKNYIQANRIRIIRGEPHFKAVSAYPVFEWRCIKLAKKLPKDVRKRFGGFYGVR